MANPLSRPRLQIKPVQKQTRAGQRTRFKAIVIIGDSEGHVGLGIKTSKEVATAIRAAIIIAKLSVIPVRRGYWGANLGQPHSIPVKESGKCGSVTVRVSKPRPRDTSTPPAFYASVTSSIAPLERGALWPAFADATTSSLSLRPAVPPSSPPQLSSVCSSSLVSRTPTHRPLARPRLLRTP